MQRSRKFAYVVKQLKLDQPVIDDDLR